VDQNEGVTPQAIHHRLGDIHYSGDCNGSINSVAAVF